MVRAHCRVSQYLTALAIGLLVNACCVTGGCAKPPPPSAPTPLTAAVSEAESHLLVALNGLMSCSTDDRDCYVIVTEQESGRFVQFFGSQTDPLIVDLPTPALSRDERSRAGSLFSNLSDAAESDTGFEVNFGHDPAAAAAMGLRVLREVYLFEEHVEVELTVR
jgi:hypothetical protein